MKSFHECARLLNWQQQENSLHLKCVLGTHGASGIRLTAVSEHILYVELKTEDGVASQEFNRIPVEEQKAPTTSLSEEQGSLVFSFGDYEAVVETEAFGLVVRKRGGNGVVLASNNDDYTTWNSPLTRPWGVLSEEEGQQPFSRVEATTISFLMRHDERFYGLGERFRTFQHRGEELLMWNVNGQGTRGGAYKNVPFFFSNYGYGVLVDSYVASTIDLGARSNRSIGIVHPGNTLRFYIVLGETPRDILKTYTALTGRPQRVPLWSFGLWVSTYFIETDEDRVRKQVDQYRELQIPVDVYHFDCYWLRDHHWNDFTWNRARFSDPASLLKELRGKGYKVSLWENPYISVFSDLYREAEKKGYLLKNRSGQTYQAYTWRKDLMPATGILDFSNPDAWEWWKSIHLKLIDEGVDVFKTDFGEAIPEDSVAYDGTTGVEMHNRYAHLYNECVYEATKEGNGTALVWSRTAWAGTQRYPTHWGGDPHCTWEDMASSLRGGLSFSLSGFAYWSHDIGGFKGVPTEELYIRWAQLGLLSAHARIHGWSDRDPWAIGDKAVEVVRRYSRLRYALLPFLDALAGEAEESGAPLMRPLYYVFPNDHVTANIDTEYLFGDALLVAPVLRPGGSVEYYLPTGGWLDLRSGKTSDGGHFTREKCSLEELPLYLRSNNPLLRSKVTQYVTATDEETLLVELFPRNPADERHRFSLSGGELTISYGQNGRDAMEVELQTTGSIKNVSLLLHGYPGTVILNGRRGSGREVSPSLMEEYSLFTNEGMVYDVAPRAT